MPESTKRTMSDIRPVRSDGSVARPAPQTQAAKPEPKPVAKPVAPTAPAPVAKPAAPAPAQEPQLAVEEFKELSAPKKRRGKGILQVLLGLLIIGACSYGIYWVYIKYYA
jgi:hypothetical protein